MSKRRSEEPCRAGDIKRQRLEEFSGQKILFLPAPNWNASSSLQLRTSPRVSPQAPSAPVLNTDGSSFATSMHYAVSPGVNPTSAIYIPIGTNFTLLPQTFQADRPKAIEPSKVATNFLLPSSLINHPSKGTDPPPSALFLTAHTDRVQGDASTVQKGSTKKDFSASNHPTSKAKPPSTDPPPGATSHKDRVQGDVSIVQKDGSTKSHSASSKAKPPSLSINHPSTDPLPGTTSHKDRVQGDVSIVQKDGTQKSYSASSKAKPPSSLINHPSTDPPPGTTSHKDRVQGDASTTQKNGTASSKAKPPSSLINHPSTDPPPGITSHKDRVQDDASTTQKDGTASSKAKPPSSLINHPSMDPPSGTTSHKDRVQGDASTTQKDGTASSKAKPPSSLINHPSTDPPPVTTSHKDRVQGDVSIVQKDGSNSASSKAKPPSSLINHPSTDPPPGTTSHMDRVQGDASTIQKDGTKKDFSAPNHPTSKAKPPPSISHPSTHPPAASSLTPNPVKVQGNVSAVQKDGNKKSSSKKSVPNHPSKAEKVAGKRRVSSKERKNASDSEITVTCLLASPVGGGIARPSGLKMQKKRKRSIRCPMGSPQMYLCEVCSKKDCGECSNCKNPSRHQACKHKPKEKCLTYMKMVREKIADLKDQSTSSEGSSSESEDLISFGDTPSPEMNVPVSSQSSSSFSPTLLDRLSIPESVQHKEPLLSSSSIHSDDGGSVLASSKVDQGVIPEKSYSDSDGSVSASSRHSKASILADQGMVPSNSAPAYEKNNGGSVLASSQYSIASILADQGESCSNSAPGYGKSHSDSGRLVLANSSKHISTDQGVIPSNSAPGYQYSNASISAHQTVSSSNPIPGFGKPGLVSASNQPNISAKEADISSNTAPVYNKSHSSITGQQAKASPLKLNNPLQGPPCNSPMISIQSTNNADNNTASTRREPKSPKKLSNATGKTSSGIPELPKSVSVSVNQPASSAFSNGQPIITVQVSTKTQPLLRIPIPLPIPTTVPAPSLQATIAKTQAKQPQSKTSSPITFPAPSLQETIAKTQAKQPKSKTSSPITFPAPSLQETIAKTQAKQPQSKTSSPITFPAPSSQATIAKTQVITLPAPSLQATIATTQAKQPQSKPITFPAPSLQATIATTQAKQPQSKPITFPAPSLQATTIATTQAKQPQSKPITFPAPSLQATAIAKTQAKLPQSKTSSNPTVHAGSVSSNKTPSGKPKKRKLCNKTQVSSLPVYDTLKKQEVPSESAKASTKNQPSNTAALLSGIEKPPPQLPASSTNTSNIRPNKPANTSDSSLPDRPSHLSSNTESSDKELQGSILTKVLSLLLARPQVLSEKSNTFNVSKQPLSASSNAEFVSSIRQKLGFSCLPQSLPCEVNSNNANTKPVSASTSMESKCSAPSNSTTFISSSSQVSIINTPSVTWSSNSIHTNLPAIANQEGISTDLKSSKPVMTAKVTSSKFPASSSCGLSSNTGLILSSSPCNSGVLFTNQQMPSTMTSTSSKIPASVPGPLPPFPSTQPVLSSQATPSSPSAKQPNTKASSLQAISTDFKNEVISANSYTIASSSSTISGLVWSAPQRILSENQPSSPVKSAFTSLPVGKELLTKSTPGGVPMTAPEILLPQSQLRLTSVNLIPQSTQPSSSSRLSSADQHSKIESSTPKITPKQSVSLTQTSSPISGFSEGTNIPKCSAGSPITPKSKPKCSFLWKTSKKSAASEVITSTSATASLTGRPTSISEQPLQVCQLTGHEENRPFPTADNSGSQQGLTSENTATKIISSPSKSLKRQRIPDDRKRKVFYSTLSKDDTESSASKVSTHSLPMTQVSPAQTAAFESSSVAKSSCATLTTQKSNEKSSNQVMESAKSTIVMGKVPQKTLHASHVVSHDAATSMVSAPISTSITATDASVSDGKFQNKLGTSLSESSKPTFVHKSDIPVQAMPTQPVSCGYMWYAYATASPVTSVPRTSISTIASQPFSLQQSAGVLLNTNQVGTRTAANSQPLSSQPCVNSAPILQKVSTTVHCGTAANSQPLLSQPNVTRVNSASISQTNVVHCSTATNSQPLLTQPNVTHVNSAPISQGVSNAVHCSTAANSQLLSQPNVTRVNSAPISQKVSTAANSQPLSSQLNVTRVNSASISQRVSTTAVHCSTAANSQPLLSQPNVTRVNSAPISQKVSNTVHCSIAANSQPLLSQPNVTCVNSASISQRAVHYSTAANSQPLLSQPNVTRVNSAPISQKVSNTVHCSIAANSQPLLSQPNVTCVNSASISQRAVHCSIAANSQPLLSQPNVTRVNSAPISQTANAVCGKPASQHSLFQPSTSFQSGVAAPCVKSMSQISSGQLKTLKIRCIDSQSSNSQPSLFDTSPSMSDAAQFPQTHNVPRGMPVSVAGTGQAPANLPQSSAGHSFPNEVPRSRPSGNECDFNDPEIESMLRKAFLEGIIRLHIIKCGISGPPETGKSHVRALMLGLRRPKQRQSTAIATEADQVTTNFDRIADKEELIDMKKSGSNYSWRALSKASMAKFLANTIHNEDYITRVTEQNEASSQPPRQQPEDVSFQNLCQKIILDIKHQLKSMKGKPKRKRRSFNGIHLLYFVDVGGQPQFQEILPNFVKCSINLLVHNLSQELGAFPQFDYVVDGKRFTIPERMQVSNITIIEQSVRSITSVPQVLSAKPHIAIIGTFKDKCQPNSPGFEEMLKRKSAVINENLQPYIGSTTSGSRKCGIFSPSRSQEQRIFAIDGSEQGWNENGDCLDKLKGFIHEYAAKITQDVPMKYFIFVEILKDYAKKKKKDFFKLDLCNKIAASADISMSSSDVKECLKLFNDVNLILYFPEVLEDVVFIKPEYLFKRVTDLIVASFHSEDEYDIIREERAEFHQTGVFTETILRNTESLQMPDGDFTQKDLLTLLKGLFIIAEVGKGKYFMPCVLPSQINECLKDIQRIMEENGIDGPLTLSFGHKMSPRGIFCSLIVCLARIPYWKLLSSNAQDKVFHRNLIQFEIFPYYYERLSFSSSLGTVILVDMNSHIAIYTTCTDKSLCPDIRRAVQRALVEACINMSYSLEDLDVRCGFPCVRSRGEGHHTATLYDNKKREWLEKCRICGGRSVSLTLKRVLWFHDRDFILSDKIPPTMELLCNKISPRTNEWKAIAINLEMSFTDVERISMESISVQERFTRVFDAWERGKMRPYTWGTMVSALRSPSVNEPSLAQDICDEFCRAS